MAPPQNTSSSAANPSTSSSSRSRPQASRKRAHAPPDDAAYHASASVSASTGVAAGSKRAAVDRPDGEPRLKRKRVDTAATSASAVGAAVANAARRERVDGDGRISLVDFSTFPIEALHKYLVQFDLVPDVDPSPLGADDPPPPPSLLRPRTHAPRHTSTASPAPSLHITPANRPRRDAASRRRSARLVEDERAPEMVALPVLSDVEDVRGMLAAVVQRHFREHAVPEVDTLASFMCAVKAKVHMDV